MRQPLTHLSEPAAEAPPARSEPAPAAPPQPQTTLSSGSLFLILGPVMGLGAFTALLAMAAGLAGWRVTEMLTVAATIGSLVAALTLVLLYKRNEERRTTLAALHNVEARVGSIVESAMDAIITVDEDQRIILFNAAAEAVFGCPREEALGSPLSWFIPERYRAGHAAHMRKFGETGTSSRRMGGLRIVTGLRRNGEEFPIDASISQISESGRKYYTVILRDVTERVRAEEALKHSKEELHELAVASSTVREQEKSRIARELHDELAQALTALKMDTAWLLDLIPSGQRAVVDKLRSMQSMLDTTVASTRRISADLRPLMLDDLGLVPAAEWLVQNFTQRYGIPCEFSAEGALDLKDPHATALFRILQESLTNISRHAEATQVDVRLVHDGEAAVLEVTDNGRGFITEDPRKPNSYGLIGLRERVYLLGGQLQVSSAPGRGTCISVRIPLAEKASP